MSVYNLVYKTPSESDSILLMLHDGSVKYASKGQYGGWVIGGKLNPDDIKLALWCFKREVKDVELNDVLGIDVVKKFVEELRSLDVSAPSVRKVTYYYKPVDIVIKKVTDKYTVLDITPKTDVLTAEGIHLWWRWHISNKGYCHGDLCRSSDREKVELTAKMYNLEAYKVSIDRHKTELRIKVVTDTSQLENYIKQLEKEVVEEEVVPEAVEEEKHEPQVEVKLPEVKPKELEVVLEGAPARAVGTATTAVETVQKPELVKVYLLSMRLPSKYLVQKVEVKEGEEVRKWEGVAKEVASRLEGIRREAYDKISRVFAHVEDFGTWVAVTDEAVKEAQKLSEWIREELSKLPISQIKNISIERMYSVKAIPIYLEPESAKELLESAIRHLSADVEELENRIKEAEEQQKRSAVKRLEADLQYRKALLDTFRKYLSILEILEPEKKEVKTVTTPVQEVEKVGKTEEPVKKPVKIPA